MTQLAVIQMSMTKDESKNVDKAIQLVRDAARIGGEIILLPELFAGLYFPQEQVEEHFFFAQKIKDHPFLGKFMNLAKELEVVLPISFFEHAGHARFNSLMMINSRGENVGVYRKSHIPDGPFYQEKFYFNSGDTGFKSWDTEKGPVGVGICWDQWYPECARAMALQGAELLLYPTAIGSEPPEAGSIDTQPMWQRAMIGHAVSNSCYVAAANRVGKEGSQEFYGSSFIADFKGDKLCEASRTEEIILTADLDFKESNLFRAAMGFFRDRRPDLYGPLLTLDGQK